MLAQIGVVDHSVACSPEPKVKSLHHILGWARRTCKSAFIRWRHDTGTPTGDPTGAFQKLPVELLYMIADSSAPSSAASLALTSRAMAGLLGPQYWHALREAGNVSEKLAFLKTLERSLPEYRLCHRCLKFHCAESRSSVRKLPYKSSYTRFCKWGSCWQRDHADSHLTGRWTLEYWHVQLVMNRHRFGKEHGIPLSALASTWATRAFGSACLQAITTPMIIDDELLCRLQRRINISSSDLNPEKYVLMNGIYREPCLHQYLTLSTAVQSKLDAQYSQNTNEAEHQQELHRCPRCPTEWTIERDNNCSRGFALVVIIWTNLGPGTSPLEEKWHSRLIQDWSCRLRRFNPEFPPGHFGAPGSIREAMERAEAESHFEIPSVTTEAAAQKIRYDNRMY